MQDLLSSWRKPCRTIAMIAKKKPENQASLFFSLEDTIDRRHPLFIFAQSIDWPMFEREFSKHYSSESGRHAKPIRLMTGLLILNHLRNRSDDNVVEGMAVRAIMTLTPLPTGR